MRLRRRIGRAVLAGVASLALAAAVSYLAIAHAVTGAVGSHVFTSVDQVPPAGLALVLGTEVNSDGRPSPALAARLAGGVALLQTRRVTGLVLSGGAAEVASMSRYVAAAGVSSTVVRLDRRGTRTYESCANAARLSPGASLVVVSQADHVRRALYLCRSMGLDASGLAVA